MRETTLKTLGCLGCLGACGAAGAAVTYQENFMNYADRAPGIVRAAGISVDNDPIWSVSGGLNLRLADSATVFLKPIALPKGKFDFVFKFKFFNSRFPVAATKDKPAVAADWDFFDLVFAAGGREHKVRVGADQIAGKALEPKLGNWAGQELGVVANGKKLAFFLAADRLFKPFAEIELPFAPESLNFAATGGKHFSITDLVVTDGDGLPQRPAAKHYAAFKSVQQPLADAKTAAEGDKLALAPAPKAGVRMVLGSGKAALKITWADGKKSDFPIAVHDYSTGIPAAVAGKARGATHDLKDATISVGRFTQFVRPKMNPFMSSYSVEPQGIDVVRDWNLLPPATKHPFDVDLVKAANGGVQLWLDGSYAGTVEGPRPSAKKGETPPPAPAFASAEIVFGAGVQYAAKDFAKIDDASFTAIDLAANPRAKAFADGALAGVKPGASAFGGYPMQVAAPLDSADVAICHQAMGNWALEVEEYHGRSPADGYPSAVHYRLPAAPYARAGILFALDPDPKKDAILTLRLGKYVQNGSGGNMSGAFTYDFSKGVPDWCKKVGEVALGGKKVPLWFGDFALNLGPVVDLVTTSDYLDFDVTGKPWENFQQMDNTMKPDPRSDSAFNLFGVTLKKAAYSFAVVEATAGNVFTADEPARGMTLRLKALADGVSGEVAWTGRDVEGAEVAGVKGSARVSFAKAGEVKDVAVDFGAKTPEGFYTCDVDSLDAQGAKLFTHAARFAILPPAGRQLKKLDSPYATWWFNAHGSPGDEMLGFPIMTKAGIRKCSWRTPSKAESEKWDVASTGNLSVPGGFKMNPDGKTGCFAPGRVQVPDPADPTGKKKISKEVDGETMFVENVKKQIAGKDWANHMLVWHESGPRGGVPEELLGLKPPEPNKTDLSQAAYVNEIGRLMRKHFPEIKLQIGNNSAAMGAAARPLRYGAKQEYFDFLGMETPAQVVKPERRTEIGVLGMLASQDVASRLAGRKIPLNGAWEFIYRADRDMGEELQAEWHARDVLICLAHDFFLISPGILFDCSSGYYNGLWGGAGILQRGPWVYPKRAYVAYAVITKVFDGVKFVRELDTGSSTIYALEYKRMDGKTVTALWCARGEAEFELDQPFDWMPFLGDKTTLVEMYGKTTELGGGKVKVVAGGRPVYVVSAKPLDGVKVIGRTFRDDAALAAKATTAAALDKVEDFELKADPEIESTHHNYFPVLKKSDFTLKGVKDEEKGDCIEVALDLEKNKDTAPYWTEYTTVRFKNPASLAGKPELIGVWVKGNSNWGQIRFEIEDANGERFKNLSTGPSWACDVMDWPGNLAVDFDGWNFVYTTLKETKLIPTHSPGPYNDQWVSEGGDKVIQYPVKVTAITVGMNRYPTSLFKFADKPGDPAIRLRDVGGVEAK